MRMFYYVKQKSKESIPGNTKTIIGHPEDPENFFNSIQELRFS